MVLHKWAVAETTDWFDPYALATALVIGAITTGVALRYLYLSDRLRVEALPEGFYRVYVRYGFKDDPDLPRAMDLCAEHGLSFEMMETSFFLGRETVVTMPISRRARMARWRQILFTWMFRNADTATAFFKLPPNRVVELGAQVELS